MYLGLVQIQKDIKGGRIWAYYFNKLLPVFELNNGFCLKITQSYTFLYFSGKTKAILEPDLMWTTTVSWDIAKIAKAMPQQQTFSWQNYILI